ncbi:MAG: NIPSNAP family containing protein [Cytophagaceae bacterium]|mgnify:CR=1 FL=1|nr:NIPSNAP family containing protein [Cytophagaceae bacterium]
MKIQNTLFCLILFAFGVSKAQEQQYYELKTYILNSEKQVNTTDDFLQNAYLPALKKQGIGPVGVFKPVKEKDSSYHIYVLLPFDTMEDFTTLKDKLAADEDFQENGKEYLAAKAQNPPYARISSSLLKAFEDMPIMRAAQIDAPREERIYELRSYQSPTEAYFSSKMDMFNAGGEIVLFDALGFNAVFYSEAIIGPDTPNLVYMVTFKNEADRDAHWKSFGESPVWKKLSALSKYQDNVSHIDNIYLYPTGYSDY